jgi:hypothetical protein
MAAGSDNEPKRTAVLRRWAIRIVCTFLTLEVVYLIVGNLCIRTGVLEGIINHRPEENFVSWESGLTIFPGLATFEGFTYRGQTLGGQVYVRLAEVNGRVGLLGLLFKTVDLRGVDGRDLDYRYRERIDYPCWIGNPGAPFPGVPADIEYYPEIPGLNNPPDPKPEEIYSQEKDLNPWTVKISGARIDGSVQVTYNAIGINGEGSVRGGMEIVLNESSAINRGRVLLAPATVTWGAETLTEDLALDADFRVNPFPAGCSGLPDIVAGSSGSMTVASSESGGVAVNMRAFDPLLRMR